MKAVKQPVCTISPYIFYFQRLVRVLIEVKQVMIVESVQLGRPASNVQLPTASGTRKTASVSVNKKILRSNKC